jgi:hypothetical protein
LDPGAGRQSVLGAIRGDDLARDHLKAAPLAPVPVAQVAAIEADHDRIRCRHRGLVRGLSGVRLHDVLADP